MRALPPDWEKYIESLLPALPPVLDELEKYTYWHTPYPQMLGGKIQAALLHFLVQLTGSRRILEVGTFTGYTTIALAAALPPGGLVESIDLNERNLAIARRFIRQAGMRDRIRLHRADALELLPALQGPYDFIFLDADKEHYPEYYRLLKPLLKKDGLWAVDNVLWNGQVIKPGKNPQAAGIARFNEAVKNDPQLEQTVVPLRDGLMLIRKTGS